MSKKGPYMDPKLIPKPVLMALASGLLPILKEHYSKPENQSEEMKERIRLEEKMMKEAELNQ